LLITETQKNAQKSTLKEHPFRCDVVPINCHLGGLAATHDLDIGDQYGLSLKLAPPFAQLEGMGQQESQDVQRCTVRLQHLQQVLVPSTLSVPSTPKNLKNQREARHAPTSPLSCSLLEQHGIGRRKEKLVMAREKRCAVLTYSISGSSVSSTTLD